jgi:tRNA A-37 threonylcarbamoyl transferase component Bud32
MMRECPLDESVDSSPSIRRTLSGHYENETPPRPLLSYRPKPEFGVDNTSTNPYSLSSSNTSSAPASNRSTISSPLSSDSSPKMTLSGHGSMAVADCHNHRENPSSYPNKAGGCCKTAANGEAVGQTDSDSERAHCWSKLLDSTGESHYETAERKHMVDMSQLFIGQKFACGTYSRLYRGQYNNQEVAVKMVRLPDDDKDVAIRLERQFHQEVSVLARLHHVNIVQFVGAMTQPPFVCVITEYLPRGSLRAFLCKMQPNALAIDRVLSFAIDIARGMEYLHSQGVLHLDLKSHNLVLTDNYRIKVTDFGVARTQSDCDSLTPDPGTYRWMAPELFSKKTLSTKVDVYSFGIILWEMVTGHIPYEEMTSVQAAFAVVDSHVRPKVPDDCPRQLKRLMEDCWADNP